VNKFNLKALVFTTLIAALGSAFLQPSYGQEQPAVSKIDAPQLKAFAKVYVEFEKIRDTYEPRLNQAQNDREGEAIQKEAASKIDEALANGGLTRESYGRIINTLNNDSELRAIAMQLIDEERKKS